MASCHTHAATKLSSHRTLRSLTICEHLCASVGGSSLPEVSVNSVNSVGEPHAPTKLSSHRSHRNHRSFWRKIFSHRTHGTHRNDWRKVFSHRLHGCAQIRRVWHPCHTHATTKLSSHRTLRSLTICEIREIRGRLFYTRSFREFRGRTLRSLTICVLL